MDKQQKIQLLKSIIAIYEGYCQFYQDNKEYQQAQQWIAELEGADDGWVKISDRLPEQHQRVLCYAQAWSLNEPFLGAFLKGDWYDLEYSHTEALNTEYTPTHWKPIAPPSE